MKPYVRITNESGGSYVQPWDDVPAALEGELDVLEAGVKLTIEILEMTHEEYRQLPEFKGH